MLVTLSMICEKLREQYQVDCPQHPVMHISSVCLFPDNTTDFHESVLYIAPVYLLEEKEFPLLPDALLSIGYLSPETLRQYTGRTVLIQINSHRNRERILFEVLDIILFYQRWSEQFLNAVINRCGCERYLELIHELIPNPMWIFDGNNCLIAYTKNDPCGGTGATAWTKTIENGYISLYGATSGDIGYVDDRLIGNKDPVLLDISATSIPFLSTNIDIDHHRAALLSIIAYHRPISQGDIDICRWLREILMIEFQNKKITDEFHNIRYEQLFHELIEGQITSEYYLQMRTENLAWPVRKYNFLILIPCQNMALDKKYLHSLQNQLQQILPDVIITLYDGSLAVLLSMNRQNHISQNQEHQLDQFLANYQLYAVISECFSDLKTTRHTYLNMLQLIQQIDRINPVHRIFYYDDFTFFRIRSVLEEKAELSSYCSPGLTRLLTYDQKKHSNLTATLYAYLKNNLSPNQTAEELFIHRSTLNYRLTKIEEVAGINLKNSNDVFSMNLSLRLLGYPDFKTNGDRHV